MASSIETHPQRNQIIEGLLAGRSYRDISESVTPRVSPMALHRYKAKKIGPTLEGAGVLSKALQTLAEAGNQDAATLDPKSVTQAALMADPLLTRIVGHQKITDRVLTAAAGKRDARGVAALIGTDLKGLELHARLTGRLDSNTSGGTQVAIVINCPGDNATATPTDTGVTIDIAPGR